MGPRRERRGNVLKVFLPAETVLLQWGRVVKDAEIKQEPLIRRKTMSFNGAAS